MRLNSGTTFRDRGPGFPGNLITEVQRIPDNLGTEVVISGEAAGIREFINSGATGEDLFCFQGQHER